MANLSLYNLLNNLDWRFTCHCIVAKQNVSLQHLRVKAQTSKEGVNIFGLGEAAEAIGFRTQFACANCRNGHLMCADGDKCDAFVFKVPAYLLLITALLIKKVAATIQDRRPSKTLL